ADLQEHLGGQAGPGADVGDDGRWCEPGFGAQQVEHGWRIAGAGADVVGDAGGKPGGRVGDGGGRGGPRPRGRGPEGGGRRAPAGVEKQPWNADDADDRESDKTDLNCSDPRKSVRSASSVFHGCSLIAAVTLAPASGSGSLGRPRTAIPPRTSAGRRSA